MRGIEIVQAGLAASSNLQFQTWWSWGDSNMGVIRAKQDTPTQAGFAYQQVYNWFINNQPAPCTTSGTVWSYPVSNNLIVWDDSQNCSNGTCTTSPFTPPTGYSQYIDLTGTEWTINGTIPLGGKTNHAGTLKVVACCVRENFEMPFTLLLRNAAV